jgi:hypothetical protein
MQTYTKSFPGDVALLRRLIGVGGATVRGVTSGTPRGTKITITETATGVLCTIKAPSIEVARAIVEKLKAIATAEPVVGAYTPSSTDRGLIGMLIGKRGVFLRNLGRKHNVKIFYQADTGLFSVEGVLAANVATAVDALRLADEAACAKLGATVTMISLDDEAPPSIPLTRHPRVIDLDGPPTPVDVSDLPAHSHPHPTSPLPRTVDWCHALDSAVVEHIPRDPFLDVPPAVVREVAGETTHTVFVTEEERESRNRTAFLHTVCEMLLERGFFTAMTPEASAHLMSAAERITDAQLARDVDWVEMVSGALMMVV